MQKDIKIPEVKNVFMAAVKEWSDDFLADVWNVYLVNDSDDDLHDLMVVSKAFGTLNGEMRKTSLMRHALLELPAISFVKIEMIEDSVLALNNEFMLTFFIGNTLYDRKYTFIANSVNENAVEEVPHLWKPGVIVK
ncbi:MAG TPA: hypothetical protein PLS51_07475 [Flavobacterium sp.]|jgi:hypothetical protein|nr:hypothetical protein [Flavobacterium sp.]HPJ10453.1 hypothetical protein [Flavobacterium sp.]